MTTQLDLALERFVNQVGHWESPRWAAPADRIAGTSRADAVFALVQEVAVLAADAEGQPRREVPRLPNDLALVDQLRVLVADLLAADPGPEVLAGAADRLSAVRHAL